MQTESEVMGLDLSEDVELGPDSVLCVEDQNSGAASLGRRLLVAARRGDTAAVLDLMQEGAPFAADWLGTSPLHLTAAHGHLATAVVLLRAGVCAEARTKVDRTPLHLAAYHGHSALVSLLLSHRAAPDAPDLLHMTPLHWAAERGHVECARVLLANGADPTLISKFGHTPRQLAQDNHHQEIVHLIDRAAAAAHTDEQPDASTAAHNKGDILDSMIPDVEDAHSEDVPDHTQQECEEESAGGDCAAARLLRSHGISVSAVSGGGDTLRAALRAGRTLLLSDAARALLRDTAPPPPPPPPPRPHTPVLRVPEQFVTSQDPEYLRAQLLQAHLSLARAQAEVAALRARLQDSE